MAEEGTTGRRDGWQRVGFLLQAGGGLFTAITVAVIGFFTSTYLKEKELADTESRERMQAYETNVRIYTELMSKREEAESALRKDMFVSIIQSFLRPGSGSMDEKVLNIELLSYNFHESLNLKPLFVYLERQVRATHGPKRQEYLDRLYNVATEISRKQMLVLESAGSKVDRQIDLGELKDHPGGVTIESAELTLDSIPRAFQLVLLEADSKTKNLRFRLEIRTPLDTAGTVETNTAEFWVGFFDFPMIDNTRLTHDQRCAVVLNAFENGAADITMSYFPGSYASLKEKPYYSEVVQSLMRTNAMMSPKGTKRIGNGE
jgi:hypothetical protein